MFDVHFIVFCKYINILLVSNSAHTSFYTVKLKTVNCWNKKKNTLLTGRWLFCSLTCKRASTTVRGNHHSFVKQNIRLVTLQELSDSAQQVINWSPCTVSLIWAACCYGGWKRESSELLEVGKSRDKQPRKLQYGAEVSEGRRSD